MAVGPSACAERAPAAGHATLVTFHRTGGFAGVDDRVVVYPDRRFTVRRRNENARHRRLSVAAMRKLRKALAAARLGDGVPASGPSGCADCFILDIDSHGNRVHLSEDKIPERMRPLVDRLSRLAG